VQNVILREPAQDIVISRQQAPYCTGMSVAYAGVGE
jgi:phage-related baseplate assembly protein